MIDEFDKCVPSCLLGPIALRCFGLSHAQHTTRHRDGDGAISPSDFAHIMQAAGALGTSS